MYSNMAATIGEHSGMATRLRNNKTKETECPVCHNNFIVPKILPCGHLVCRHCIILVISSKNELHCPVCKYVVLDQNMEAIDCAEIIADSLTTNIAMEALALSVDVLSREPECCVCDGVKADYICLQCRDTLCSLCITVHKKLSATSSHCVESLRTVTAERVVADHTQLCADHGQRLSFYCSNHNLAVCAISAIKEHEACSEINDLDGEMELAKVVMTVITQTLTKGEKKIEQSIKELDISQHESASCQKLCDNLITICSKQKELTSPDSSIMKAMSDTKEKLYEQLARIRSYNSAASRARAVSSRPGLVYAKRALQERMKTLDLTATILADMNTTHMRHQPNFKELVRRIKSELRQLEQQGVIPEQQQLTFHRNRGHGVVLGWNGISAECQGNYGGVVASSAAMETNFIYEVRVVEMKRDWKADDVMFCGITGTHPVDLNIKQRISEMEDVKICRQAVNGFTINMKKYDTIGLMIDPTNNFHFYLNKLPLFIAKNVPRPCYVVFDFNINVKKLVALPAVKLPNTASNQKSN